LVSIQVIYDGASFGAFHFSQQSLPFLLKATKEENAPTLIFTGATASVKSNAQMASFSTG